MSAPYSRVIITRPRQQNSKLQKRLTQMFLEHAITLPIVSMPLLEIVPIGEKDLAQAIHRALTQTQWVSFVSPNAFWITDQLLKQHHLPWPVHLKIAVVGGGSERSIVESGLEFVQIVKPQDTTAWDSEGLWEALQLAQAQWQGVRMVMIHGEGGRNFLAEHLLQAGAQIEEFAVYRRQGLATDDPAWGHINTKQASLWVFNSSQAGQALQAGLKALGISTEFLQHETAIVSHPRIAAKIQEIGFGHVQMIAPGDEELMKTLLQNCKTAL
jgi:uroporphyrinogen-III synthase